MNPRAAVGVGQHRHDLRGQAGQIGQFPQQPHPGVRHHATAIGHFGNAAIFTGRKLKFDAATRKFNDATATGMLSRELRKPWSLEKL